MGSTNAHLRNVLKFRLESEGRDDLAKILARCSESFKILCSCCGEVREVERGCKKRWCPVCAPKITAQRVRRFSWMADQMKWPLAVTLTATNTPQATGCIKKMRKAIGKLRETKLWGGQVAGGLVSFEVTNTGKGWHPHAHLLIDCRWLSLTVRAPRTSDTKATVRQLCEAAHAELSKVWARCLQQPLAVTWVERAWGKAILETVKYAVKPMDLIECKGNIGPLIDEMKHMKLVNGFGTCYGSTKQWKKDDKANKPPSVCPKCEAVDSWELESTWDQGKRRSTYARSNQTTVPHSRELRAIKA